MTDSPTTGNSDAGGHDENDPLDRLAEAYEHLADKTKSMIEKAEQRIGAWLEEAIDAGKDALEQAGNFTREEVTEVRDFLIRDLDATRSDFQTLAEQARKRFNPSRLGAGFLNLVEHLADGAAGAFDSLADKVDHKLTYRTGEISGPGTLMCHNCGRELHMEHVGRVPPCPECRGVEYHRSY